jgi:DNA-binding PadR family transcriptional regulator
MAKRAMKAHQGAGITPVEFHILLALVGVDRHGYAIMQQVAADSGDAIRLGPGTLYGALARLLDYGFIREVESGVDPALDDSRRRYYRLTAAGRTVAAAEAERLASVVKLARARQLALAAHGAVAHGA